MLVRFRISDIGFGISEIGPHDGHPVVAVGKAKHARGSSTQMIRVEIVRAISTRAFQDIDGKAQYFRSSGGIAANRLSGYPSEKQSPSAHRVAKPIIDR